MSQIYKVIKRRCKDALVHSPEVIVDIPMSSIDYDYSIVGCVEYLKNTFSDYKVKFIEPDKVRLKYRPKNPDEDDSVTKQNTLEEQTRKLLRQFPDVQKVEYIQVSDDYRTKKTKKKYIKRDTKFILYLILSRQYVYLLKYYTMVS